MSIECTLLKSLGVSNQLGEGVLWHTEQQSLWWTDINGSQLYRYDVANDQLQQWATPERVGCFGFVKNSSDLIVAFESGIGFYRVATGEIQWIARPEAGRVGNRFNDGKVDPFGRFWAGGMVESPQQPGQVTGLYRVDVDLTVSQVLDGFHITNGLCWSPTGDVMYHADSPSKQIYSYDFAGQSGQVSNKQLFAQTAPYCVPDGSTVDNQGGIWNAQWGGSQVIRYLPDGSISYVLDVPMSQPTCVAFGGPDMNLLFVTSARKGLPQEVLDEQPQAGDLMIYQTNVTGIASTLFG